MVQKVGGSNPGLGQLAVEKHRQLSSKWVSFLIREGEGSERGGVINAFHMVCSRYGWLVGCFGFNGPLRQYSISVYIGPSPKEREKE